MNIIITNQAHKQMQEIFEYISRDSSYYAQKTIKEIYLKINILEFMPYIGRKIPEYNMNDMRELIYKSYRIMYKIIENKDEIHILIIHNSKQSFKTSNNF